MLLLFDFIKEVEILFINDELYIKYNKIVNFEIKIIIKKII